MIRPELSIPGSKPLFDDVPLIDTLKQDDLLIIIAKKINWDGLISSFSSFFNDKIGRPALSIRLMIGLLLLKYIYDLSDEDVVLQWEQNIYYQAFTGQNSFTKHTPCSPSQLSVFRKKIGKHGCELIFAESVRVHGPKALESDCIADTTAEGKEYHISN
jgi:IS5 family transposase